LNLSIIRTNNFNPWTQHDARNIAIKKALGFKLIFLDIDHIVTKRLIDFILYNNYDVMKFQRRFGILDRDGNLQTDKKTMIKYGALESRIKRRGCRLPPPGNVFAITKKLFLSIDITKGKFWHILKKLRRAGKVLFCKTDERPFVYMFPVGRYCGDIDADPLNLFHNLSRNSKGYRNAEKQCGAR